MPLSAVLTCGWPPVEAGADIDARTLYDQSGLSPSTDGVGRLQALLPQTGAMPIVVDRLDDLFRRSASRDLRVVHLAGALAEVADQRDCNIHCRIDVFAYAFLKATTQLDLLLPQNTDESPFSATWPRWRADLQAMHDFEERGDLPRRRGTATSFDADRYLSIREVLARASAEPERHVATMLLTNGPSTVNELAFESDRSALEVRRSLRVLSGIDVVSHTSDNGAWLLNIETLPIVLFCLRAIVGFDPFANLSGHA